MCIRIKIFATSLQDATKTVKFVEVVPKTEGSDTICAHRNAIITRAIFKNVLEAIFTGMICSCAPLGKALVGYYKYCTS